MFYVYEWYIVETDEIIYVGKGCGQRYKVRKHNKQFNEMINRFHCDSRIIEKFENEQDAFDYEYTRIKELQDVGQCVCNKIDGGRGGSASWWTDELRKKYSENNVMKSEAQRKRMSRNNPMKDKDVAKRVANKKSKAVIIGGKEYPSVKAACLSWNTSADVIATWCRKGVNSKGEQCYYKGDQPKPFNDQRYNKGSCKKVVFKEVVYESVLDFSKAIGIGYTTAHAWLERGFSSDGIPCRFYDDKRDLKFVNRYVKRNKDRAKPVIINNVWYRSCDEASKMLNIPKSTLYSYLNGSNHNIKYICKYDNQQPSQGMSV